jgi:hypothetical protein
VLYHGVLAPHHRWRAEVVPKPPRPKAARERLSRGKGNPRWLAWSELLWRVFRVDGWACPLCARPMRLRAVVDDPSATVRILDAFRRGRDPPPPETAVV